MGNVLQVLSSWVLVHDDTFIYFPSFLNYLLSIKSQSIRVMLRVVAFYSLVARASVTVRITRCWEVFI